MCECLSAVRVVLLLICFDVLTCEFRQWVAEIAYFDPKQVNFNDLLSIAFPPVPGSPSFRIRLPVFVSPSNTAEPATSFKHGDRSGQGPNSKVATEPVEFVAIEDKQAASQNPTRCALRVFSPLSSLIVTVNSAGRRQAPRPMPQFFEVFFPGPHRFQAI